MKRMIDKQYDVVVVGGGVAGAVAAIQAGRAGANTLLIEKNAGCGGTTTSSGVSFPGLFHYRGHQIIRGIGWEWVEDCVELMGTKLPDFSKQLVDPTHWHFQIQLNPALFMAICDEKLVSANVDTCYHTMLGAACNQENRWNLTICGREGLRAVSASVLIDATGDATASEMAGAVVSRSKVLQPGTMVYHLRGYSWEDIDPKQLSAAIESAVTKGELYYDDIGWNHTGISFNMWQNYGGNSNHILVRNPQTSAGRSDLEQRARFAMLRFLRFSHKQPGLENLEIDSISSECGVRESGVVEGDITITAEDYTQCRIWPDSMAFSYYPVDLHSFSTKGVQPKPFTQSHAPTIPLGALLPKNTKNLIVAGRIISSDRLANSGLRVQASCMAMGQVAGMAAAMAVKKNCGIRELESSEIRTNLKKFDAICPKI